MKIIIVGAGKVGYSLCEQLSREDHDIIVIDTDAKLLEEAQQLLDIMVIQGNGASLEVLKSAGVQDTDVLIACTNADEINLLCCISAKKLGCKHTIARVRNPEYNQQIAFLREQLGLSLSINPEQTAAQEIYRLIQFPLFLKRDSFDKGRVELVELKVDEGGKLEGKRIMDVTDILGLHVLVCAVERGDQVFIPNGRFELKANDRITVTA
ncbi:MAG: NAD-binding protein, partial [Clostridia bacterium]|nr:NAD-binding protein [Clostridia bacterium]